MTSATHEHRNIDWTNHYAAIGKFVVEFERLTSKLRFTNNAVLQLDGLKHWQLSANILNSEQLGPRNFALCLRAAIHCLYPDKEGLLREADAIIKGTTEIVELRNKIAHGDWVIGEDVVVISDTPELSSISGFKIKTSKEGSSVTKISLEDVKLASDSAAELRERVSKLFGQIVFLFYPSDGDRSR